MSTKQNTSSSSVKPSQQRSVADAAAFRKSLEARTAEDWCREGVSLCIPRVFANIGYKRIFGVFRRLGWGYVQRVDTIRVQPKNGPAYKRAYVHYTPERFNQRNSEAMAALEHMIAGNDVQLEYEDGKPWFWKVSLSQARKPDEAPKPPKPPAVRLTQRRKVIDIETSTTTEAVNPLNDPIAARAMQTFSNKSAVVINGTVLFENAVEEEETDQRQLQNYGDVAVMDD